MPQGNLQGLVNDPDFQKLAPADQRAALFGVTNDESFKSLRDGDTARFVSSIRPSMARQLGVPRPPDPIQQAIQQQASQEQFRSAVKANELNTARRYGQAFGFSVGPGMAVPVAANAVASTIKGALPVGQYEAPASSIKPPAQLTEGVIEPEYLPMDKPKQPVAVLRSGAYQQPPSSAVPYLPRGVYEQSPAPEVKQLPQKASAIPLPERFAAPKQPIIRTTPSEPLPPLRTVETPPPAEATSELKPVQAGNLPKPKGDPYSLPRTPSSMNILQSSNIAKAGYHPGSQTMVVEFRTGRVYELRGVPKEIFQQFMDSESHGSFYSRELKGRYETNYRGSVLGKKK